MPATRILGTRVTVYARMRPGGWHTTNTGTRHAFLSCAEAQPQHCSGRDTRASDQQQRKHTQPCQAPFHVKHPSASRGCRTWGRRKPSRRCGVIMQQSNTCRHAWFATNHANRIRRPRPQGEGYRSDVCRHDLLPCGDTENGEPICQEPLHVEHQRRAPLCELSTDDSSQESPQSSAAQSRPRPYAYVTFRSQPLPQTGADTAAPQHPGPRDGRLRFT